MNELNSRGILGPAGGRWHTGTLLKMLENTAYVGILEYGKRRTGIFYSVSATGHVAKADECEGLDGSPVVVEDAHEPIISFEVFELAQSKLLKIRRKRIRTNATGYPLTGILTCGHCGFGLIATINGGTRYYRCSTASNARGKCHHYLIQSEAIERFVIDIIEERIIPEVDRLRSSVERELETSSER